MVPNVEVLHRSGDEQWAGKLHNNIPKTNTKKKKKKKKKYDET